MTGTGDSALIESIRNGTPKERHTVFENIYRGSFHSIENYVVKNKGTSDDARDIFQDGMMVLYRNITNGHFKEQSSIKTYLFSICRNLWLQGLRRKSGGLETIDGQHDIPEEPVKQLNMDLLNDLVHGLKDDCRKILTGFYYERKTMEELTTIFQLGSEQATRNKKMRCMKELMKIVEQKKMGVQSFWI
jgi:RNA polymerase sigma factor (sigma-70 family)